MKPASTPIIICPFPGIMPINTIEDGIAAGQYNSHNEFITNTTVQLQPAQGPKNVYLVCFDRELEPTEWTDLLRAEGKQPCINGPNYLLGLMAQVSQDQMPEEFRSKDIVAAENARSSIFADEDGDPCFLYVSHDSTSRKLDFTVIGPGWYIFWAFLAQDI